MPAFVFRESTEVVNRSSLREVVAGPLEFVEILLLGIGNVPGNDRIITHRGMNDAQRRKAMAYFFDQGSNLRISKPTWIHRIDADASQPKSEDQSPKSV